MSHLCIRHLAILYSILFALIAISKETPSRLVRGPPALDSLRQGHSQQLPSQQLQHRDLVRPVTTEISSYRSSQLNDQTLENRLTKRQRLNLQRFRVATIFVLWAFTRTISLVNQSPHIEASTLQSLKNMYSQIRHAAINEWAKLPQQSVVRITFGRLIFTILPPADRTVPWTEVEEVAYTLLLLVSAGLGGLVTGTYLPIAASGVVWCYLAVIAPGPQEQIGGGSTQGVQAPPQGTG